ncbi:hypothetical protein ABZ835_17455 [Streptomyces sp. NPDC047461]|uniref:hypothetical protein n=1 Tax=Streptomyces sp. NPDC047461 TaxID=3155619 RepID=UPI0033F7F9D0
MRPWWPDPDVFAYEGRCSGDDNVTAFHTSGNLGTLTDQGPTDAAKASLVRLIKVISRFKGPRAR